MLSKVLGRTAVVAACVGLSVTLTTGTAAASTSQARGAVTWLAAQAHDDGGFGDAGLTADAIFAFVSADAGSQYTAAAVEFLSDRSVLDGYIGTAEAGFRAPQTAKILLAAQAAGADVTDFGGVNLEAALRGLEGTDGRFSGVLAQQLSVLVLARSDQGVSSAAVDALAGMQCDDGGYSWSTTGGACTGDVDFTAYALAGLLAAGEGVASERALNWLESVQGESGGFTAGFPGAPENSNSTGLAAGALASGGRQAAADKAVAFVLSLQQGCDAPADEQGGIAYDASGFQPGNAIMATAQSVTGLTGEFLDTLDFSDDTAELPGLDCGSETTPSEGEATDAAGGPVAQLPVTGSSLTIPVMAGVLALLVGATLLVVSRRRVTATG
ncbi:LPXTG-motif cell wall-anchored protein [Stackebrandtia endophytica]|uniref:LPXTG-motif cell wall-anchored protein n=1 Tax=Stackebrandtia endophytica TaxID=1496996 RepID=A0A543B377_9ACTN|nr:prenyltransferase/squalene oxidase repeat-containing protein [Stackebrandtia endophytica]TQL79263.1 LPXTG-motif cell wall-anchored protein [Stackebrandtia endophytica]